MSLKSILLEYKINRMAKKYEPTLITKYVSDLSELLSAKKIKSFDKAQQDVLARKVLETTDIYPVTMLLSCGLDQEILEKYFPEIKERIKDIEPEHFLSEYIFHVSKGDHSTRDMTVPFLDLLENNLAKVSGEKAFHTVDTLFYSYKGDDKASADKVKSLYMSAAERFLEEEPERAVSYIVNILLNDISRSSPFGYAVLKDVVGQVIAPSIKGNKTVAAHLGVIIEKKGIVVDGFNETFADAVKTLKEEWNASIMSAQQAITGLKVDLRAAQDILGERRKCLTNSGLYDSFVTAVKEAGTEGFFLQSAKTSPAPGTVPKAP